jgi:DNA-binding response OmpR family regulator
LRGQGRVCRLACKLWNRRRLAIATPKTILCVSDEPVVLHVRQLLLEHEGYQVLTAAGENAAGELLRAENIDLVLLDYSAADARRVAAEIRKTHPSLRLVAISFSSSFPEDLTGLVDGWVSKTRSPDVLLRRIEQLLRRKRD